MWQHNGTSTTDEREIADITKGYFQNLFITNRGASIEEGLQGVNHCITTGMNSELLKVYNIEEVLHALKEMALLKATSEDGFSTLFFHKFWHIMDPKIGTFFLQVLNNEKSIKEVSTTLIILIPKIAKPKKMQDF